MEHLEHLMKNGKPFEVAFTAPLYAVARGKLDELGSCTSMFEVFRWLVVLGETMKLGAQTAFEAAAAEEPASAEEREFQRWLAAVYTEQFIAVEDICDRVAKGHFKSPAEVSEALRARFARDAGTRSVYSIAGVLTLMKAFGGRFSDLPEPSQAWLLIKLGGGPLLGTSSPSNAEFAARVAEVLEREDVQVALHKDGAVVAAQRAAAKLLGLSESTVKRERARRNPTHRRGVARTGPFGKRK